MKIFLSWSGPRAERIAHLVERALLSVYPGVRFFHSSEGVTAGETWRSVIGERLSECDFGIVFLTPDRPNAPWLQFEAGAIAKRLRFARVVPFLVGVHLRDVSSPLQAYEPTVIGIDPAKNKAQFLRLLESIAVSSPSPLKVKFSVFHDESWWSELDERLRQEAASFWHPDVYVLNEAPLRTYQDSYGLAMSMLARCRRTDLLSGGFYFHSNIPGFRDLLRSRACKPGPPFKARVVVQEPDSDGWKTNVKYFYAQPGNEKVGPGNRESQRRLIEDLRQLAADSHGQLKFATTKLPLTRVVMRFDESALVVSYGFQAETLHAPATWIPDEDPTLRHFKTEFKRVWKHRQTTRYEPAEPLPEVQAPDQCGTS